MGQEFYIGQIFEEEYPPEAAAWCNSNNCRIIEIDRKKNKRRFEIKELPEKSQQEITEERIIELKNELNATDYKIIKCSECSLAGEELPYDIVALHAQRQALRDEINELENA